MRCLNRFWLCVSARRAYRVTSTRSSPSCAFSRIQTFCPSSVPATLLPIWWSLVR